MENEENADDINTVSRIAGAVAKGLFFALCAAYLFANMSRIFDGKIAASITGALLMLGVWAMYNSCDPYEDDLLAGNLGNDDAEEV
ncbi:MAG: hypothetical protein COA94_06600 [Rickettsiales bacterium]|nr:MAG: hypothetical protein COA94_06600 [Rickettsiales bacterium]